MSKQKTIPQKVILAFSILLFLVFLVFPMFIIVKTSVFDSGTFTLKFYSDLIAKSGIGTAVKNSVLISSVSGLLTTVLAFIPAYAINYTNINKRVKKVFTTFITLPMLLPTITYGFALMYSYGNAGLITRILGFRVVRIYGIAGLIIGYVIYTLPISFMLLNNSMSYIDKKFMVVSRLLGDSSVKTFFVTVLRPLISTLAISFIQSFTLSFTDYGIPAALAGNVELLSTNLYNAMLGSLPDFNSGSAISVIMLLPSVVSILLIGWLDKYNIRYSKISKIELKGNKIRDAVFAALTSALIIVILSVFIVIFMVPFTTQWPYYLHFTLDSVIKVFSDNTLMRVYKNSLFVSVFSALAGTLIVYGTALISARKGVYQKWGKLPDTVSLVTNTIPGMVLGVGYMMAFKGTVLQNTFPILILCNIVHFYSSPYLMVKGSLEKLNASWETTARLMGDSWMKTVLRIITPNVWPTLLEAFSYFFVNAMVTVSAIIFLAGTRTMIITAKIKELQHFAKFNEIFVLSILILFTNLLMKGLVKALESAKNKTISK